MTMLNIQMNQLNMVKAEKVQEHGVAGEALNIAIGEKGKQAVSQATDAVSQQVSNISMPSYTPSASTIRPASKRISS